MALGVALGETGEIRGDFGGADLECALKAEVAEVRAGEGPAEALTREQHQQCQGGLRARLRLRRARI